MFTLFPICHMWHPCWISPLPLQHKKCWELWNTESYALNWKCTWKGHPSAQIIFTTARNRSKGRRKRPFFVIQSRKIPWRQQFASQPAASVLIFCQEVRPLMLFLLLSQLRVSGPASFWQDSRRGSTCFLSSDPCTTGGCPCFTASFFSLPWPITITGQRLIPCSMSTDLVLRAKLPQKRCALGGLPHGDFCSNPWSVSSSICQNASSNEVLLTRRA